MSSAPTTWRRVAVVVTITALVAGIGWLSESIRFGGSDDEAFARVERYVRDRFADISVTLRHTAVALATHPMVPDGLAGDRAGLARLFDLTRASIPVIAPDLAVTIYDATATARAWTGRPSEIPRDRILGASTFFIAPGPLGLRLVYVEPILVDAPVPPGGAVSPRRVGSVSTELVLSSATGLAEGIGRSPIESPLAPLALRPTYEGAGSQTGPRVFTLDTPDGELILEAEVADADLEAARSNWRRTVRDLILAIIALVLVLTTLPELARAPRRANQNEVLRATAVASCGLLVACALLWTAGTPGPVRAALFSADVYTSVRMPALLRSPSDVLLLGLLFTVVAATAARLVDVARLVWRRRTGRADRSGAVTAHMVAGTMLALVLAAYEVLLADTVTGSLVDVLHPSLNPWDSSRLGLLLGLLLAAAAAVWIGVLILVATRARWTRYQRRASSLGTIGVWLAPGLLLAATPLVPAAPYVTLLAGCVAIALVVPRLRPRFRHASETARISTIFVFLIVPVLLAYPSMAYQGLAAKRRVVEEQYAPQAARQPDALLARLSDAQQQIDALIERSPLVASAPPVVDGRPNTDSAFLIWRETDLARLRLTSAIELYGPDRSLASRFALNFPEYAGAAEPFAGTDCGWDVFGEVSPFGSQERRLLHAERAICGPAPEGAATPPAITGAIVIHLPLDYQALPFIASQNPYVDVLRSAPAPSRTGRIGADVDVAIYGWGLSPIFTSGAGAWTIDEVVFDRIYASRDPFWTTLASGGRASDVYIMNNRGGIYALGYLVFTPLDHLLCVAEIVAVVGLAFLLWIVALTLAGPFARGHYHFGRELARELRSSFYRRLFLAFVAVAVIPVLVLALIIRNYSSAQLRSDAEAGAARTAVVAQRVIEELRQAAEAPTAVINDDLLVFVSQVIDQDVNIFEGSQLVATSERDLFASGLLPTRTPDAVYNAIALAHAPSFVTEDAIGQQEYLVAAAPIRSAGADAILTVPLTSRQQEIERQINDLDRGILLGVTLLVLLGAASGFYIAERIADPVQRLTRATQRIARGDFEARVVTRSADELERLVSAFNRMGEDLKEQRRRLERTHRLEAWAEMARQVAHEIKNPLTPVQLSAEHLLRVHRDRGEPLGSVLQSCVDSILKQVRILRHISSEFSSYASSPRVERAPTALVDLVNDVLDSYRAGVEDRIHLTVDIPSTLPLLMLDRTLVGRALTNVIENALHAMPADGRLTLSAVARDAKVELIVEDTGVGLDEATLARIFEPYFSTRVTGTGLGMANAKRNVELNTGTIEVRSQKGSGTQVTLTFPLGPGPETASADA